MLELDDPFLIVDRARGIFFCFFDLLFQLASRFSELFISLQEHLFAVDPILQQIVELILFFLQILQLIVQIIDDVCLNIKQAVALVMAEFE